jgi:hypothetical protein
LNLSKNITYQEISGAQTQLQWNSSFGGLASLVWALSGIEWKQFIDSKRAWFVVPSYFSPFGNVNLISTAEGEKITNLYDGCSHKVCVFRSPSCLFNVSQDCLLEEWWML